MYMYIYKKILAQNNVIQPLHTGFTWYGDYQYALAVIATCAVFVCIVIVYGLLLPKEVWSETSELRIFRTWWNDCLKV